LEEALRIIDSTAPDVAVPHVRLPPDHSGEGRASPRRFAAGTANRAGAAVHQRRGRLRRTPSSPCSPIPDRLLDQLTSGDPDPAAAFHQRDSVALAFITAIQQLPATQRAALLLHDVLAYSPAETAQLLDTSVAAANSLLQRARATLTADHGTDSGPGRARPLDAEEQQIVRRFERLAAPRHLPA